MPSNGNGHDQLGDLVDVAGREKVFTAFLAAVAAAGMIDILRSAGPYTLFAPTDRAFAKFPASTLSKLMRPANRPLLSSVLGSHLAFGAAPSRMLAGKRYRARTLEGRDLRIDGRDEVLTVNGAPLSKPDIIASNGVLHGIEHVLWPKPLQERAATPESNSA
jgi:uncharacterized surface protein with fasciclin (FAS1) repeats